MLDGIIECSVASHRQTADGTHRLVLTHIERCLDGGNEFVEEVVLVGEAVLNTIAVEGLHGIGSDNDHLTDFAIADGGTRQCSQVALVEPGVLVVAIAVEHIEHRERGLTVVTLGQIEGVFHLAAQDLAVDSDVSHHSAFYLEKGNEHKIEAAAGKFGTGNVNRVHVSTLKRVEEVAVDTGHRGNLYRTANDILHITAAVHVAATTSHTIVRNGVACINAQRFVGVALHLIGASQTGSLQVVAVDGIKDGHLLA